MISYTISGSVSPHPPLNDPMIRLKSIYAEAEPEDGTRILVMRRWPRGVKKERIDEWVRGVSPSRALLQARQSKEIAASRFFEKYRREMSAQTEVLEELARREKAETLTLLCWEAKDEDCHRHVLKALIEETGSRSEQPLKTRRKRSR